MQYIEFNQQKKLIIAAGFYAGNLIFNCQTCGDRKTIYGCIEDAQLPVITIDCVACGGSNPDCRICGGIGQENIYRCPVRYIEQISEFLTFYGFYKKGFLPELDGMLDQSNAFIEACAFLDSEIGRSDQENIKGIMNNGGKQKRN